MNYGIVSNNTRDAGYQTAIKTAEIILGSGNTPVFEQELEGKIDNVPSGVLFASFDQIPVKTIISIGGDGTFLSVVTRYRDLDTEFIGINKGSIGFLTEITEANLESDITKLMSGEYSTIERTQLRCEVWNNAGDFKGSAVCLNDILIVRGQKPHITKLELFIDGQRVEKFYGDGLIVSTATGSSAYSLAAGGPLLMPSMKDIIVTPVSSHTLYGLKYVAGPESEVRVVLDDFESAPIICPDGRDFVDLEPFDSITIRRHNKVLKTATLKRDNFFSDVRKKIVQRGSFYENS